MNPEIGLLGVLLSVAAVGQIIVAGLNLFLVRLLGWRADLERMSLLLREVFQVHSFFISFSVGLFGVLTLRFSEVLSTGEHDMATWLSGGIAIFWGIRTLMQLTHYSSSHWRGKPGRTAIHFILLFAYGGLSALYGWVAWAV